MMPRALCVRCAGTRSILRPLIAGSSISPLNVAVMKTGRSIAKTAMRSIR
jgi:hypothetical protein